MMVSESPFGHSCLVKSGVMNRTDSTKQEVYIVTQGASLHKQYN
jgi:hypothetical protein